MRSKGGNGVSLADEFRIGQASTLPVPKRGVGAVAEPLDPKVQKIVSDALAKPDAAIFGNTIYTATKAETDDFNAQRAKTYKENGEQPPDPITIVQMAQRKAGVQCRQIARYAQVYVDEYNAAHPENKVAVGQRFPNDGTDDNPKVQWAIVLTKPHPRKATAHGG